MAGVRNKKLLWISAVFAGSLYFLLTLPFALLAIQSEYFRFITVEQLAWKAAKLRPPKMVFAGDSITAGGRNWGMQLGLSPLAAVNLAGSGYFVSQIHSQVIRGKALNPEFLVVLAGTNDVLSEDYSFYRIRYAYSKIFDTVKASPEVTFLITSIPPLRDGKFNERVSMVNDHLRRESAKLSNVRFLEFSKALESSTVPEEDLYTDGVHLDGPAYRIWAELIRQNL